MKKILFTLALLVCFSSFGQQLKAILMLGDEDLISDKQDDIERYFFHGFCFYMIKKFIMI